MWSKVMLLLSFKNDISGETVIQLDRGMFFRY